MFAPIGAMPDGAIGFEARGLITGEDARATLEPGIDGVLARGRKVRLLYSTGTDFAGYTHGRLLDESVFGSRRFSAFERIAFVGDEGPHSRAVGALDGLMPVSLRLFRRGELDAAKSWLRAEAGPV